MEATLFHLTVEKNKGKVLLEKTYTSLSQMIMELPEINEKYGKTSEHVVSVPIEEEDGALAYECTTCGSISQYGRCPKQA